MDAAFEDTPCFTSPYCGIRSLGRTVPKPTEVFGFIYWFYTMHHPNMFDNAHMNAVFGLACFFALSHGRQIENSVIAALSVFETNPHGGYRLLNDVRYAPTIYNTVTPYDRRVITYLCDAVAALCQIQFHMVTYANGTTTFIDPVTMCLNCRTFFHEATGQPSIVRTVPYAMLQRSAAAWSNYSRPPPRFEQDQESLSESDITENEPQHVAATQAATAATAAAADVEDSGNETISISSD